MRPALLPVSTLAAHEMLCCSCQNSRSWLLAVACPCPSQQAVPIMDVPLVLTTTSASSGLAVAARNVRLVSLSRNSKVCTGSSSRCMNLLLLTILFRIVIVVLVILMIALLFGLVHVVKGICVYWSLSIFLPPSRFCVGRKIICLR